MVHTRSTVTAAQTLLSLKDNSSRERTLAGPSDAQLWSMWTAWYHAFASEIQDELGASSRLSKAVTEQATAHWATFCAKKLRCDKAYIYAWLQSTDSQTRMDLA